MNSSRWPRIAWSLAGVVAALGVLLGAFAPAFVAYGTARISFVRMDAFLYALVVVGSAAIVGILRRRAQWVLISGTLATLGAMYGLLMTWRMVQNGPAKGIPVEAAWGHLLLLPSAATLFLLGLVGLSKANAVDDVQSPAA